MYVNYLKTALRNIIRNKVYTSITVFGLATAIMCALFIFIFAEHEMSYDRFHGNIDNLYQVLTKTDVGENSITPTPLAPFLKDKYPEILEVTRYHWFWGENYLQYGQDIYTENKIRLVDPGFFDLFEFPFLEGDPRTALADPNSIVMTRENAEKYFGNENPLGKTVILNHEYPLTVTGIIENVPTNSSLQFDMLMPIQFNIANNDNWYLGWNNLFVYTFVKCREDVSPEALDGKIAGIIGEQGGSEKMSVSLVPFKQRYFLFYSDKTTVTVLLYVAGFILLIAAFNFMNLSTVLSIRRAGEIGVRKVLGAKKRQIMLQYLGESTLLALIAAVFAVLLFYQLLPVFRTITGGEMAIPLSYVLSRTLAVALVTGIIAGIYPAFFLAALGFERSLKSKGAASPKGGRLRKSLVVVQFVMSLLLLLGMTIVYQQTHYIQNKDLGYHKDDVVCIPMGGGSEKYYQTFKEELLREAGIDKLSGTALEMPFFGWHIDAFKWEGKDPDKQISISYNEIDYDFLRTMDVRLAAGRDMSREFSADEGSGVFINEKMAELMGLNPAPGVTILQGDKPLKVIGVIKNFHFSSLRNEIEPLILLLNPSNIDNLLVRLVPGHRAETLARIKTLWGKTVPDYPFRYSFLDEDFERSLTGMKRMGYLLTAFASLAVIISCLGLFGLSSFIAEQRTKEIGIRKVHGASILDIIKLFFMKFIPLVMAANVIVWPLSYYLMKQWLDNFAYRTQIHWQVFLLTAVVSVLIAFLSVGYKSFKAATANPIKALKYE